MWALWREFPSLKQETSALNPTPRRVAEPSRAHIKLETHGKAR